MPLRRKLLLSMVIPALLLGMVGAIGLFSLRHQEQAAGRILADNYRSIQEARRMSRTLRFLETPARSPSAVWPVGLSYATMLQDFENALARCEGNITVPGEIDALQAIRAEWNRLRLRFTPPLDPGYTPWRDPAFTTLHTALEEVVALNEEAMFAFEQETRGVARGMVGAVTISALVALAGLALFALISAYRISRPISEVADRLHQALNPSSRTDLGAGSVDEIARLRQELDALLARLKRHESEQARKLSRLQDRLAFVMNEVLEGLVLMDSQHRILTANRVGRAILGMPAGEGQSIGPPNPREDVRKLLAPVEEGSFQPERDLGEFQFVLDGSERVFRPRVLTVPTATGDIEGYLILFWDVTEQRRFEESRRRFISMLSHQLKTPMTSLAMSVRLIQEKLKDSAHAELISIAAESCSGLSGLISDLVEAARDMTPDLSLKPSRMDLGRLLSSALRPLISQAEEKQIELVVPAASPPIFAAVDPVKFPWVVTNIAGNALRYTPRGGRIVVAMTLVEGRIEVSVTDTGSGIAPENLVRIFQPYVSLDPEPRPGTHGLGLAIAREIVEAHGGTIEASSKPGRGTRFLIRLSPEAAP